MDRNELVNNANEWFDEDNKNRAIICIATENGKVSASVNGDNDTITAMLLHVMKEGQAFADAVRIALYNYDEENILKEEMPWTDKN